MTDLFFIKALTAKLIIKDVESTIKPKNRRIDSWLFEKDTVKVLLENTIKKVYMYMITYKFRL